MGKLLGDMTPGERRAATERALGRFQAELTANADAIGKIMDSVYEVELTDMDDPAHPDLHAAEVLYGRLRDAIDLASDQNRRTWVSYAGKRVAVIATVQDGDVLEGIDRNLASSSEAITQEEEVMILRTAAEVLKRRFGPANCSSERLVLKAAAERIESGRAPR